MRYLMSAALGAALCMAANTARAADQTFPFSCDKGLRFTVTAPAGGAWSRTIVLRIPGKPPQSLVADANDPDHATWANASWSLYVFKQFDTMTDRRTKRSYNCR